jgi:hypothetical protein
MIHHTLSGAPPSIIGNSSNKKGEFSLIRKKITSFQLFPYIAPKKNFDPLLAHSQDLMLELLGETNNLKTFKEPVVATLLPNFFTFYYGQKVLHSDITTNKVKAKMMHLGTGYDLWVRIMDKTLTTDKLDSFLMVTDKTKKDPLLIQRYFLSSWNPVTLTQLALNNGPCGTITNVQSDDYPQAAHTIKKFILPNLPAPGFPQAMDALAPGELEKESKAIKGFTKLMLLHLCANIDYKNNSNRNILFAAPSNPIEVVLSQPHNVWPNSLANLICQTLMMTKEQDPLTIQSKHLSIQMVGKTVAAHTLSGNFSTNRVTVLNNKANSINPSALLTQWNTSMVKQEHIRNMITNTKRSIDVLDMHKSKAKTSIACIGTMTSILNFLSLCIKINSNIMVITTKDSPLPILRQFLTKFIKLINKHQVGLLV